MMSKFIKFLSIAIFSLALVACQENRGSNTSIEEPISYKIIDSAALRNVSFKDAVQSELDKGWQLQGGISAQGMGNMVQALYFKGTPPVDEKD